MDDYYKEIGYKLIEEKYLEEIDSKALVFEHIKTGARLIKLENDDKNNVFGIGFRTPPRDSTGVAHILEHSVLSGSRKYKTKEPFMDLYKGSLQTFLNAMTFGDKTIYPVASRNKKDFENLMDLYLDAVFYPAIDEKPEIFMQEGWHYSISEKEYPISYKGVVYNEMKGAMSSAEDQVFEFIDQSIFPDTVYANNSGGDPYEIPSLTHEGLVDFHKSYYNPSNSYIFLYGDRDTYEDLKYLDQAYLGDFDKTEIASQIPYQEAFDKTRYENYEYSTNDDLEGLNRDYLAYNVVLGESAEDKVNLTGSILAEALINSDAGPIKKALLDAKIGEDIFASTKTIQQVPFSIVAKNTSSENLTEFEGIIDQTLKNLVENGIDKDLLKSTLNKFEYSLREASGYPTKGVIYYIQAFDTWLYDKSPIKALSFDKTLKELRQGIEDGYFENFIRENILENTHKSIISVLPSKGLNGKRDEEVKKKLEDYKASLSDEALEALIETNKKLEKIQLTEDSKEAKATIPKLPLSEVEAKIERIPRESLDSTIDNLYHDIFTSGINYVDLVFDMGHIGVEDIPYVSLLTDLLGSMDTTRRTYSDLSNEIYINTGGISFNIVAFNDTKSNDFYPKLVVSSKYLDGRPGAAVDTIIEIITSTKLDNIKRYKDLIKEIKSRFEMSLYQKGSAIVSARARSLVDKSAKYNEYASGLDYFNFIQDLEESMEEDARAQLGKLEEVYSRLFTREGLLVNITSSREEGKDLLAKLEESISKIKDENYDKADLVFGYIGKSEGIKSSANVQYVSMAASMEDLSLDYKGKLVVLSQVLSRGFLHNNIRAKGGAYGAGLSIGRRTMATYSYRDPNLVDTIRVYKDMGSYIENIDLDQDDLGNYIIGTMGMFNPPRTPKAKGYSDLAAYLTGLESEEIERLMEEALDTKIEDLKAYGPYLDKAMSEDKLVVLGNREKIEEEENLFDKTYNIIK